MQREDDKEGEGLSGFSERGRERERGVSVTVGEIRMMGNEIRMMGNEEGEREGFLGFCEEINGTF